MLYSRSYGKAVNFILRLQRVAPGYRVRAQARCLCVFGVSNVLPVFVWGSSGFSDFKNINSLEVWMCVCDGLVSRPRVCVWGVSSLMLLRSRMSIDYVCLTICSSFCQSVCSLILLSVYLYLPDQRYLFPSFYHLFIYPTIFCLSLSSYISLSSVSLCASS